MTKKLDNIVSLIVRERDKNSGCITCRKITSLECGHYYSRSFLSTRWDLVNCNGQCRNCNLLQESNIEIEKNYRKNLIKKFGVCRVEELDVRHRQLSKLYFHDMLAMYNNYKSYLEMLTKLENNY